MVLVIGAAGTLGNVVCKTLKSEGIDFKVCTRKPDKLKALLDSEIEIFQSDLSAPESYKTALQGVKTVILSVHNLFGDSAKIDRDGAINLIDLCVNIGVKNFIYISILGADPHHEVDFFRNKYEAEKHLMKSGLNYTIIRPAAFMEFHIAERIGKGIIKNGKVKIFGSDNQPNNFVSISDVAALILKIIRKGCLNETLTMGGPDNLRKIEVAKLYGKHLNIEPKISYISSSALRFISKMMKPFHKGISRVLFMSAVLDDIDQSVNTHETNEKYEIPLTSVEEFVKEHVARMK